MLTDLAPAARALADAMSGLSEAAWHAAWMEGTEYALWAAVVDGPYTWGRLVITPLQIAGLRRLADAAGGWVVHDDEREETFMPMAEWLARFAAWRPRAPGR
jgi:hypothetical protein